MFAFIEIILAWLAEVVIAVINATGYVGVFVLMALESANIPIPSEVTMPFSGYIAQKGNLSFWVLVFIGAFGNLFGSWVSYYLAEWIVRVRHKIKIVHLLISDEFLDKSQRWFDKYGSWSVFFSRLLPVVRTFISLPAGLGRMNIFKFSVLTFVGSLIWSWVLTYIGFVLGQNWMTIEKYFRQFNIVVVALLIIVGIWWAYKHFKRKKSVVG